VTAAKLQLTRDDPGSMPIDVPQKEGGDPVRKSFSECSLEELRLAVKHKRAPSQDPQPASDMARIELMRESLSRHFAQGARVQLKTSSDRGKTLVTIQGVPLEDMERLMEALMDGLVSPSVRAAG
jgi:translation initiation factor 1 (eIF-1/SUI1)